MSEFNFTPHAWPKIAIVAGEASGDILGSGLIVELLKIFPNAEFVGVAGPKMLAAGATSIEPMETLSVGGIVEVLKHLPKLLALRKRLIQSCQKSRPDLFIGIDAPDFNLGLAARVKRLGIPTVHYVSPSIWAWRPERIKKIKKAVNHILLLLPFEKKIYEQAEIPATYVGHPLADQMPIDVKAEAYRELLNIPPHTQVLALLPGSRQREVTALAPLFIETVVELSERYPKLLILVPFVTRETRLLFEREMWLRGAQNLNWRLMFGHSHEAMSAADVVLLASGTAALESMLAKRPTVVAYRVSNLTYRIVKSKYLLPFVSLPNIISDRFLVPEFLQHEAKKENLTLAIANYLEDKSIRLKIADKFTEMHLQMRCSASIVAAQAIQKMLASKSRC
ncbi:lipid-A-disaccharide synthase [Chitinibacter bivalviorum]|uniref:Lipid-A-disaccharide synthase n=1 Tax=Chitinibacter bivalviorum TaxID=2739434 RepID=A0A7H9BIS0_9NEIS|nr:lipid-A-disaccharide synthase [Chitinibacter bivalviorum]QLG87881.1 lipid-A-disaccharide synthase [Chitinibacter bivalviorum]